MTLVRDLGRLAAGLAAADVTVQVNTTSDTPGAGQCSLREALAYANGMPESACGASAATGVVTIRVPAGCYELSAGALVMPSSTPVVIDGAGPGPAACTGGAQSSTASSNQGCWATATKPRSP